MTLHGHTTKADAKTFGIRALVKEAELTEEAATKVNQEIVRTQLLVLREIVTQAFVKLEQRFKHEV